MLFLKRVGNPNDKKQLKQLKDTLWATTDQLRANSGLKPTEYNPLVHVKLLRRFKDIPADVQLDIFGEIYEYFLSKFALAEGQGGGEFLHHQQLFAIW